MRKIKMKIVYGLLMVLVAFTSCDNFLNQEPVSDASVTSFYKTESEISQAVNGAYNALMSSSEYGGNFIYLMEIRSDNTYTESITNNGGVFGDIDLFRETSYNSLLNSTWVGCYDGIKRCNVVLDNIDNVKMEDDKRNSYKGEMLFLRALTYFNMVRLWGELPIVTHYYENPFDAFKLGRSSIDEVYALITSDLKEAIQLLPSKSADGRLGAVVSSAAQTLLGKVYLTMGQFENAASVLNDVINEGNYKLLDSYAEVFDVTNKNSEESIFEIQYTSAVTGLGSAFANMFAPIGSKDVTNGVGNTEGNNEPTEDLYNSYEAGDARRDVSIGKCSDGRLYCKKWVSAPVLPNQSDANFIVLRYADVLLMYAEALNELGYSTTGDAFKYLNIIRKRAGLKEYSPIDLGSQAAFRNAIYKERRSEFAMENQRWFDLLRTGKAIETINKNADVKIDDHQLLYPIPQNQIDISPETMKQNDRY